LFCFVLFCFVLFCFVLFCFVLFCFVLFCFVLFLPFLSLFYCLLIFEFFNAFNQIDGEDKLVPRIVVSVVYSYDVIIEERPTTI
jgi:hypothetical protein